jgi:hypothetical protein
LKASSCPEGAEVSYVVCGGGGGGDHRCHGHEDVADGEQA